MHTVAFIMVEAERGQIVEECLVFESVRLQPLEIGRREPHRFQHVQELLESCRDQEVALRGKASGEKLEHRFAVHGAVDVSLQHRQLIQVGQQRAGHLGEPVGGAWLGHGRSSSRRISVAPAARVDSRARSSSPGAS